MRPRCECEAQYPRPTWRPPPPHFGCAPPVWWRDPSAGPPSWPWRSTDFWRPRCEKNTEGLGRERHVGDKSPWIFGPLLSLWAPWGQRLEWFLGNAMEKDLDLAGNKEKLVNTIGYRESPVPCIILRGPRRVGRHQDLSGLWSEVLGHKWPTWWWICQHHYAPTGRRFRPETSWEAWGRCGFRPFFGCQTAMVWNLKWCPLHDPIRSKASGQGISWLSCIAQPSYMTRFTPSTARISSE